MPGAALPYVAPAAVGGRKDISDVPARFEPWMKRWRTKTHKDTEQILRQRRHIQVNT
jgi:hypothetical protein